MRPKLSTVEEKQMPFNKIKRMYSHLFLSVSNYVPQRHVGVDPLLQCPVEIQVAEGTKLTKELEKECNSLAANLPNYKKVDGEETFTKLTASLFPCQEAHAAYSVAIDVAFEEAGGVRLLIGLFYILALNVLFLTFLYFVLFILAFFQALQIRMLNDVARDNDGDSICKC
ncbi:unnamed protein product [Taenia asiatica]|uniref:Transmembrane protein n=1 Tax=Taenia asiatica TaxID=60517 RepID=A0A0R3VXK2_TAEAS|nr:unnamed protein product [Taenia asiatica]